MSFFLDSWTLYLFLERTHNLWICSPFLAGIGSSSGHKREHLENKTPVVGRVQEYWWGTHRDQCGQVAVITVGAAMTRGESVENGL